MKIVHDEAKEKLFLLELNTYEKAAELIPRIIEVIREFDGKVYNRKLPEALTKLDGRLYVKTNYGFHLAWYIDTRHVSYTTSRAETKTAYININEICLCDCITSAEHPEKSPIRDKRIQAPIIIAELEREKAYYENTVRKNREAHKDVKAIIAEKNRIEAEIKAFEKKLINPLAEYYGLYIDYKL
jgi:hypothetical protein